MSHERYVSNHRSFDCLFNRLCGLISKKHQSPRNWPFVMGIHRWPVKSPHKGPVTGEKHPLDDLIMCSIPSTLAMQFNTKPSISWFYFSYLNSHHTGEASSEPGCAYILRSILFAVHGYLLTVTGPLWYESAGQWVPIAKGQWGLALMCPFAVDLECVSSVARAI